jgi:hypothetical protein
MRQPEHAFKVEAGIVGRRRGRVIDGKPVTTGWSSSSNAQHVAIDASRTNGISIYALRAGRLEVR